MTQQDSLVNVTSDIDQKASRCLHQAIFILGCLCEGELEDDIMAKFQGDKQLMDMWVIFLKHNHWLFYEAAEERWALTEKGKEWALR